MYLYFSNIAMCISRIPKTIFPCFEAGRTRHSKASYIETEKWREITQIYEYWREMGEVRVERYSALCGKFDIENPRRSVRNKSNQC